MLLLTYKALNDLSPEYISELLNKPKYTRNLRSQSQHLLSVPKSRTVTYGDRAFSVCAPKLWNELPFQLRMSSNIQAFKSGLKAMLFKMAFLEMGICFIILRTIMYFLLFSIFFVVCKL